MSGESVMRSLVIERLDNLIHLTPNERVRELESWRNELEIEIGEEGATDARLWELDQVRQHLANPSNERRIPPPHREPLLPSVRVVCWQRARRPCSGRVRLLGTLRTTLGPSFILA